MSPDKDEIYFDELGNEIHLNDLLRVYHFRGARKRRYYMYKVAIIKDGFWYGKDYSCDHTYVLMGMADKVTRIIKGTRVIARGDAMEDVKIGK